MAAAAPHVMVLALQEQGHVTASMELSHRLVEHGLQVSFVCTERIHNGLRHTIDGLGGIHLVPIPDGLADGDDHKDLGKSHDAFSRSMPGHLEELLRVTKVKWLVVDGTLVGLCLEVAKKLGVRVACFFPLPAAYVVNLLRIPKLIEDGFFDDKGLPKRRGAFELEPNMPPLYTSQMPWCLPGGPELQQAFFQMVCRNAQAAKLADVVLCNSFLEAEATAFEVCPDMLPVGPMCTDRPGKAVGQLVPVDTGCLEWLDTHPDNSVVYVAFGSTTVFNSHQTRELAQGLELTGRPFLWVVRPDFTSDSGAQSKAWFDEFKERTTGNGMVVSWCPQQQVLAHRAVGCFLSHCGWNSVLEALTNGVPVLCSPYFLDQFTGRSYICDIWRSGLALSPGEDGALTKEEVSTKVERIITHDGIAERARMLSDASRACLAEGGSSYQNFERFATLLKME